MAVPQVSHRNWWLTQANAQIALGNHEVDARNLSFARCLQLCAGERITEEQAKDDQTNRAGFRLMQIDQEGYTHPNWNRNTAVVWEVEDRDRPHRPTVPGELIDEWQEAMAVEWPTVPTESLSFDRQRSMFLKRRHEWLSALEPTFTIKNETTGETAKLDGPESILD